jgi:SNF2 family DNA or RNA helicase
MLVHKEKRALIFKLREPNKITTVIPTAKLVRHNGDVLVAVPHRPDEVRVLRQLGFSAPDPMRLYYNWPGRYTPMKEQIESSSFATMNSRCFVLNSMGTGKTITVLWSYDYLRSVKLVKRVLIACPLSVMERTWADHVFQSFPHLDVKVLYGTVDRRRKLLRDKADIYIINVDGLPAIRDDLASRPDIDLIIVDESALYRNGTTRRWKTLNVICNRQVPRRVWALTGAPTPNLPTDAWAQGRVINPGNPDLPKYFNKFRDMTMRQISQFKWLPRPEAVDVVQGALQPAIRYTLDDMIDLPEQMYTTRDVQMTPEQTKAYKDMLSKLAAEYAGGQIMAVNEAVKVNKLVQIACGVAYDSEHEEVVFPAKPRMDVVLEVIEESEGKVIIFVPFTSVLTHMAKMLTDEGHEHALVHGEVSKNERDKIYARFQDRHDPLKIIVATPGTMSHGLTLTEATTIIWFAPIHSNETYRQACARVRRPGQTRTTVVVHIAACEVERRMYNRLEKKESVQGVLLDILKYLSNKPKLITEMT